MTAFVSVGGPNKEPPAVKFIKSVPDYGTAVAEKAKLDALQPDGFTTVIYRSSSHDGVIFVSRQIDPSNGGRERHSGEPVSDPIGYDLFTTPTNLLSAVADDPPEYELVDAIKKIFLFSHQGPTNGGP
jgi:hypothetical protein